MPILELKHLRTLQALKAHGSLVDAADTIHVTQSALSHQIKDLEMRLGCQLLVRKSRPLQFTPAGEKLLTLARQVLPKVEATESALSAMAKGVDGRLHIALECHSCFDWLLPTLDQFRRQWPDVELDLGTGFSFNALNALSREQLDLVITADPNEDPCLSFIPLFKFPMLLAHSNDHWLSEKSCVTPQDLASETLIIYPVARDRLAIFTQFLDPAGVEPAATRQTELTMMMIQLVASDLGVCVLPNWALSEYLQKNYICTKPLGTDGLTCTLYAAVRKSAQNLPYLADFIRLAGSLPFSCLTGISPVLDRPIA